MHALHGGDATDRPTEGGGAGRGGDDGGDDAYE